jgi:hypothetical protein
MVVKRVAKAATPVADEMQIELVQAKTYMLGIGPSAKIYRSDMIYKCPRDEAEALLSRVDDRDLPIFRVYVKRAKRPLRNSEGEGPRAQDAEGKTHAQQAREDEIDTAVADPRRKVSSAAERREHVEPEGVVSLPESGAGRKMAVSSRRRAVGV